MMSNGSFTLEEAQTLLPVLNPFYARHETAKSWSKRGREFQELSHRVFMAGGMYFNIVDLARRKASARRRSSGEGRPWQKSTPAACQVKDLEMGCWTSPARVDGVRCCFAGAGRASNHSLAYHHEGSRPQAIDERIVKAKGRISF